MQGLGLSSLKASIIQFGVRPEGLGNNRGMELEF